MLALRIQFLYLLFRVAMQRREVFLNKAVDGVWSSPGVDGLLESLQKLGFNCTREVIEEVLHTMEKSAASAFTETHFNTLVDGVAANGEDDTEKSQDRCEEDEVQDEVNSKHCEPVVASANTDRTLAEEMQHKKNMVEKNNVDDASPNVAEHMLKLVEAMHLDHALVQSFHDEQFAKFMVDKLVSEAKPLSVYRAEYARDFYYTNVQRLLLERLLASRSMQRLTCGEKFLPIVSTIGNDGCAKEGVHDLIARVIPADIPIFEKRFFEEWALTEKGLHYCVAAKEDLFEEFATLRYFPILKDVVDLRATVFEPKYDVNEGTVCSDTIAKRRKLISSLTPSSGELIITDLKKAWAIQLEKCSQYMSETLSDSDYDAFEREYYYVSVETVAKAQEKLSAYVYNPLVLPETSEEQKLIEHVNATLAKEIEKETMILWKQKRDQTSPILRSKLPDDPPLPFLKEIFFTVVRHVVTKSVGAELVGEEKWEYFPAVCAKTADEVALVANVTQRDAKDIEFSLRERWEQEVQGMMPIVTAKMPKDPPLPFLNGIFYDVVRQVLDKNANEHSGATFCSNEDVDVEDIMFECLKTTTSTVKELPHTQKKGESVYVGAMQILTEDLSNVLCNFEGYLTSTKLKPRSLIKEDRSKSVRSSPSRKRNVEMAEDQVVDVIALDKTGVAIITFWHELVDVLE